jgi:hypothetical protein
MSSRDLFLAGLLLLLAATAGVWILVIRWSRQGERHIRAWTLCWSIVGLVLLLPAVSLVAFGVLWSLHPPSLADYIADISDDSVLYELHDHTAFLQKNALSCLLPPGLLLGVAGVACLGIACCPEDRRFTAAELAAAGAFLFGLFIMCMGSQLAMSRTAPADTHAYAICSHLLPGFVITLIPIGWWYIHARADEENHGGDE